MILKNNLFHIKECRPASGGKEYTLTLNPAHFIYRAHFPNNPITPGVCLLQIVKELAEEELQCALRMKKINHVKFLNVINPEESPEITCILKLAPRKNGAHPVESLVARDGHVCAKLSMLLTYA